ncbi:MAG TPA: DUF1279 domain-containing protein [Longimicrobium sp.]|jgi:hypothetical protein
MKINFKELLAEYGRVAIAVYLVIFVATLVGSWMAIRMGWRPAGAAGNAGTFAAAYLATKLTQPLRIAATLVLTPLVAKLHERITRGRGRRLDAGGGAVPQDRV